MFKLRKILSVSMSIILTFVLVIQSFEFKASAANLGMSVTAYSNYFLVDADNQIPLIQAAGNLTGRASSSDAWMSVQGYFDYAITADTTGWYELILTYDTNISGNGAKHTYIIDGDTYLNPFPDTLTSSTAKVGNVWLTAGTHTFRIQKWLWTGLGPIKSFEFKPVGTSLAKNVRVGQGPTTPYGANGGGLFLEPNETYNLNIFSAGTATGLFTMEVYNKDTNVLYKTYNVNISSSSSEVEQTVAVGCADEGTYYIKYKANGTLISLTEGLLDEEFTVIDNTPDGTTGSLGDVTKVQIGSEIDCSSTVPNYVAGNNDSVFGAQQRLVTTSFGGYLETGDNGYLGSSNPNYVAYTLPLLQTGKHYLVEIDYPDDAERSFAIILRQQGESYATAGGIDSGYEYPVTNTMKTFSLNFYMNAQSQPRIGVMTSQIGLRAAISKIRLYEVIDTPSLLTSTSGRDFGSFYEEGLNLSMYGTTGTSKAAMMKACERWAKSIKYNGGNVLFPAVAVYQISISPSGNYDLTYSDLCIPDYFKMLLIYAEKYGLSVIADFSRNSSELNYYGKGTSEYQKNLAMDKNGNYSSTILNPIYPANQEWMDGYLTDFANKYKNMPSFKGVSIRSINYNNSGFTNFNSLDYGYDDYTAQQFCSDTGIADPGTPSTRYDVFTSQTYKHTWIDWRVSKINATMQRYSNTLKSVRSDLMLYSLVTGFNAQILPELGIKDNDIDGFQWIYGEYQYGRKSTSTPLTTSEYAWSSNKTNLTDNDYLSIFSNSKNFCLWANYNEDGGRYMKAADLGLPVSNAWISAHLVPSGRNYLERYAIALAKTDAQMLFNGGNSYFYDQPIVREFMQEYRQLPKVEFSLVNTIDKDVVVRDYNGSDYEFYLVNQTGSTKTCTLDFGQAQTITRLSSGTQLTTTGNKIAITLEPYQLIAYRSQGGKIIDVDGVKPSLICTNLITDNFEDSPTTNALWKTESAVVSPSEKINDFSTGSANGNSYLLPAYQKYAPYQSYITTIQDDSWNKNNLEEFETKILQPAMGNNKYVQIASNIFLYQDPATKENVRLGFSMYSGSLTGYIYKSNGMTVVNGFNYNSQRGGYPINGFSAANWMTVNLKYDYSVANTVTVTMTFTNGSTVSTSSFSFSSGVGTLASGFKVGFGSRSWADSSFLTYYDDVKLRFEEKIADNFENTSASNSIWQTHINNSCPSTKANDFSVGSANGNSYLVPAYQRYAPYQSYITTIKDSLWNKSKLDEFQTKVLFPAMGNNKYTVIASNIFLYQDPVTKENVRLGFSMYSGSLTGYIYKSDGMTVVNGTNYNSQRGGYPINGFSTANWMAVKAKYDYSVANTITITLTFTNGTTVTTSSFSFCPNTGTLAPGFKAGFGSHSCADPTYVTYYDDVSFKFIGLQ